MRRRIQRVISLRRGRAAVALVVLAGICLAASGNATASQGPGASAIAQYVEMVPTGSGDTPLGVGAATTMPLTPKIKNQITKHAGNDAALLQEAATSSAYGAPTQGPEPTSQNSPASHVKPGQGTHQSSKPTPTTTTKPSVTPARDQPAIPSASVGHTLGLLMPAAATSALLGAWLGLALVTAAAVALFVQRRHA